MKTEDQLALKSEWTDAVAQPLRASHATWLMLLARNVKFFRRQQNLSQEVLADRCGIYRTYLSRIETGKCNPSLSVLVTLAVALEVQPQALLATSD